MFLKGYFKIIWDCYKRISQRFKQRYRLNRDKDSWLRVWRRRIFCNGRHPAVGKVIKVTRVIKHLAQIHRSKRRRVIQKPRSHNFRLPQRSLLKRQTAKSEFTLEKFNHNIFPRRLQLVKTCVMGIRKQVSWIERKNLARLSQVWRCTVIGSSLGASDFRVRPWCLFFTDSMLSQQLPIFLIFLIFDNGKPVKKIDPKFYKPPIFRPFFLPPLEPSILEDLPPDRLENNPNDSQPDSRDAQEEEPLFKHICLFEIIGNCYCHEEFGIESARKLNRKKYGPEAIIEVSDKKHINDFEEILPEAIPCVFERLFDEFLTPEKHEVAEAKEILKGMQESFVKFIVNCQEDKGLEDKKDIENLVQDFVKNKLKLNWIDRYCDCEEKCCFEIGEEKLDKHFFILKKIKVNEPVCIDRFENQLIKFFNHYKNIKVTSESSYHWNLPIDSWSENENLDNQFLQANRITQQQVSDQENEESGWGSSRQISDSHLNAWAQCTTMRSYW